MLRQPSAATRLLLVALVWFGLAAQAVGQDFPELDPEPLVPLEPETERPPRVRGDDRVGVGAEPRRIVHAHAGISLLQRSYTLDSKDTALEFASSLYPAVYVGADLFPFRDTAWLEDVGVAAEFKRGVDRVIIEEGGVTRKVPVRHSEFGLFLAYRHQLDDAFWMRAETGFTALDFVLARNPFYTNTTYRALRLAVNGEYRMLPWLTAFGDVDLYPVVTLGASEAEFGESSSTFGAGVALGALIDVVDGVFLRAGYMIRFFNTTFDGTGQRELESVVTTDVHHDLTFWVGYRL